MSAVPLARLRGASAFEALEGSCSGAAEGLEIGPASPLLGGAGHSGRLALPPGQGSLPASVLGCASSPGDKQRLPLQAEVSSPVKKKKENLNLVKLLSQSSYIFSILYTVKVQDKEFM